MTTIDDVSQPVPASIGEAADDRNAPHADIGAAIHDVPDQLVWLDADGAVIAVKPAQQGRDDVRLLQPAVGRPIDAVVDDELAEQIRARANEVLDGAEAQALEYHLGDDGGDRCFEARVVAGRGGTTLLILRELTERRQSQDDLQQAQRLEAIGRLAGGIAHEINTPIQFIGDNVRFLKESFTTTVELLNAYRGCLYGNADMPRAERVAVAEAAEQAADVRFLMEEVPQAADETLDGVERVAAIVRAMKTVGRAPQSVQGPADLNAAIESTTVVSRSEYKQVAEVDLQFGDVPPVTCHIGELNQVFINLIVNAAHAISDRFDGSAQLGRIVVRTEHDGDDVVITFADNGCGMPESVRRRIFDPFFTTKEVGRGTGQGLSLSRAVVTDRHGGSIAVDSTPGEGTTFVIRLPIAGLPDDDKRR